MEVFAEYLARIDNPQHRTRVMQKEYILPTAKKNILIKRRN
jgi:hypothetical protein